jgi:outer membrane protein with beta-barrel domain
MKYIVLFLLTACLTITISVKAQTTSGNMMLGGTLSFYSTSIQGASDYKNTGTSFSPSFGYFIADNIAVGGNISIGSATTDNGFSKTVQTSFGIGPFARYYKFTSSENFAFFAQAQILYSSGKTKVTPAGTDSKSSTISFSVAPGFAYFFTKHWAFDLSISGLVIRSYDPNTDANGDKESTIQLNLSSLSPSIGLRYHFGN